MSVQVREELLGKTPYESFDDPSKIRLGTNENPNQVSREIADEIGKSVADAIINCNQYPADEMIELRIQLSEFVKNVTGLQFSKDEIFCGNGSSELLFNLHQAFVGPTRKVLTFSPTYMMYSQYARDSFSEFVECPRNADFSINLEVAKEYIEKYQPSMIMIANPNNPTGNFTPVDIIEQLLQFCENVKSQPLVVLDEAYKDFIQPNDVSAITLLSKYKNLAVSRTLSKAFSFAGVRFGYIISNPDVINAIRIVRLPYNVSTITQTVVKGILPHYKEMLSKVNDIKAVRDDLYEWLKTVEFKNFKLIVVPSSSNFIQIGFPETIADFDKLPKLATEYIYERGMVVRCVGPKGYFRVSIGTKDQVEIFKQLFMEFLNNYV
jgi:histidinol-phosphate aminotransferase